jgi:hypothetical protein
MTEKEEYPQHPVYDKNSIEFVTVAAQFCSFVENCQQMSRGDFFDKLPKLLSLLYLKTAVVPTMNDSSYSDLTQYVTEESYEYIQMKIKSVIGRHDEYLDVFVEDMQYSDTPILCNISEDISDIYQDLKDMICNFHADIAFFSAQAMDNDGEIYDCFEDEIFLRRAMIKNAKTKVFLCDNTKVGKTSSFHLCSLKDVDYIASNLSLPNSTPPEKCLTL